MTKPTKAICRGYLILFFCASFAITIVAQQSVPASSPQTPTPAQNAYEVKIEFNRRVPMRDRTELSADVYRPNAPGRFPVVLSRTPYTKTSASTWNTCQLYRQGHRIRIEISSAAFPKYDRNLNTGEALGQTTRMLVAQQKIYHDRQHLSFVVLPIVPRKQ